MRKLTLTFLAIVALTAFTFAQEDESYTMFDNTRLVVKTDRYKEFGKAMANHNKTYHNEGPYHANVWSVSVGEDAGQIIWSMGPCTYTEHDGRPSGKEHMEDWLFNVMPNVKYIDESNFWKILILKTIRAIVLRSCLIRWWKFILRRNTNGHSEHTGHSLR